MELFKHFDRIDGTFFLYVVTTPSRPMVVGECVKLDLENPRVIARGAKSIAGQDTGKPARISSEQTQDISSGLLKALNDSTRETRLLGTTPDPNAQAILGSRDVQELDKELATLGLKNLQAYSGGAFSVVLEAQGKVVRIGFGEGAPRPNVPEVLQAEHSGQVGFLRYEVLPKVDTHNISNAEVQVLHDQLNKRGYQWGDAGTDNVGRVDGRLVAIDPGGIEKVTSNHRDNTPKLDESGRDQVTEPASERVTTAMQIER